MRLEAGFHAHQAGTVRLNSLTGAAGGVNRPLAESLQARNLQESFKDIPVASGGPACGGPRGPACATYGFAALAALSAGAGFLVDFAGS